MFTEQDLFDLEQARIMGRNGVAKMAREARGFSLREVAKTIGTSPVTILYWERGDRRPSGGRGAAWGRLTREFIRRSES